MKKKTYLLYLCCNLIWCQSVAQTEMFIDAFYDFSSARIWEFEQVKVDWKMEGMIQADLNDGINYLLENNPRLAESSFSKVLIRDSLVWEAYYFRSAARKQLEKFELAQRDIEVSLKLHGDFYEGWVELAKILHLQGEFVQSEKTINKAVRLDKSRGAAFYIKGDINLSQNQIRQAIKDYEDCIQADSLFHDARIKLALLDGIAKKDFKAALKHLNQVLVYDSLQRTALLFRAILVMDKDARRSVKDLSNLVRLSPGNYTALWLRGISLAKLQDYERAFTDFHKVIQATATSDNNFKGQQSLLDKKIDLQNVGAYAITRVYGLSDDDQRKLKQAYCNILTGEYVKSISVINEVSNHRKEPLAVYLMAVALEHRGAHQQALQYYNLALAIDDQISDAYKKRGIYNQELKEWNKSIQDFNSVLKISPDNFFTYRMRGVSYYYTNRFREAIEDFSSYLKNHPTNKEVISFRGIAYLGLNDRLNAYIDFAASYNHAAINFQDLTHLLDSVLSANDSTLALRTIDAIIGTTPYFTEGYARKFKIHAARNEWQEIEKELNHAIRNSRIDAPKSDHSYLLTLQGTSLLRTNHPEHALVRFNEALRFDNRNSLAYLERGKVYLSMGKVKQAKNDFKRASGLGNNEGEKLLTTISE